MSRNTVRWARITSPGDDDQDFAVQQMEYLGKTSDGFMVFPYGLHGNVPADSLALMFAVQDQPENRAAIGWTPKDRPTLGDGEVAFYHPPTDAYIIWRQSGDLEIVTGDGGTGNINITCKQANITASESATIDSPESTFTGNVQIDGNLNTDGAATLGGAGGAEIARKGDAVSGGFITGGSAIHKAT